MASSLCKCLLRVCFDETPEDSPHDESQEAPRSNRISRLFQSTTTDSVIVEAGGYNAARLDDPDEDPAENDEVDNCCQNDNSSNTSNNTMSENNPHLAGLRQFWHRFTERFHLEDSAATSTTNNNSRTDVDSERERMPILTQASSFDSSKEVPTIQTEHIVLPGSELQQEMAKAMACKLEAHDDECVICMEGFDPTNPRMPTLCGCGQNKTYFHLPCLYQWIEQSRNCPSCRKRLRWEEF